MIRNTKMKLKSSTVKELSTPLYISQMIYELQECLKKGEGDSYTEAGLAHYWKEWKKFLKTYNINKVPEILDPIGSCWEQPDPNNFAIDNEYAIIDDYDWEKLATYNTTRPSGVYAGKMWKRITLKEESILCWYGYDEKPNLCSINERWVLFL